MTYSKNEPTSIQSLFNAIAPRYDFTNKILSGHLLSYWNRALIKTLFQHKNPTTLLDLCAGTGEISLRALAYAKKRKLPLQKVVLVDFSKEMIAIANERAIKLQQNIQTHVADVTALPLLSDSFDIASCAYGLRNVNNPTAFFTEAYRVLKPHGSLFILELTRPHNSIMRFGHNLYLKHFIPKLGKLLTRNQAAYDYLRNSIQTFLNPEEIVTIASKAGFRSKKIRSLCGGIATLIEIHK